MHINNTLVARTDDLDATLLLLVVEGLELPLLLPVVDRADKDLWAPNDSRIWKVSKNESNARGPRYAPL